ncbi:unnamed protein product [Prorocentrum cordatum]|uniref:Uncharacterized protein n=1 Tax=Prorocentrum cordatum TaxID=2364126 RepID=A0ABN9VQB0_9DINO|nr:unnamed protein product [Polarella glacialis]
MAISVQKIRLVAALALSPWVASAGECPVGAAPFPSGMASAGRQQYANLFDISYYGTYKVVHFSDTLGTYKSSHPTKANERIPDIVLWQCGTTKPAFGSPGIDDAFARFFEIPIQRATLPLAISLPQFELLSVTEKIYAMDFTYVSSACAQLMEECVPSLHVTSSDDNYSAIAAVEPGSVVFTNSFGTGYTNTDWDVEYQSSVDPAILNRAEWTNFVGAFFNLEAQAKEIFSTIEADYLAMKSLGSQLGLDSNTEWGGRQPQVIWVEALGDTTCAGADDCVDDGDDAIIGWTQPGGAGSNWCKCGGWQINTNHYKKNLVEDAGGKLVALPQTTPDGCVTSVGTDGSARLGCGGEKGLASFRAFLAEADVIVDETYISGHDTAAHDFAGSFYVTAADVPALARDPVNIFRADGTVSDSRGGAVGSAWFDWGQAEPQQLLAGMMGMLWGGSFESPCGLKYFRRAVPGEGQEQVGHDDCPYWSQDGNHDCAAIHDHLHEVRSCMPAALGPGEDLANSATARGFWVAAAASMSGLAASA